VISVNTSHFALSVCDDSEPSILGAPPLVPDNLWYLDSGTTHHLTHDESSFTNKTPYTGSNSVTIGNGVGLHIKHIGFATYTDSSSSNLFFSLN